MEKKFMDLWVKNKHKLEDYFRNTEQREYDEYKIIVKKIFELVINDDLDIDDWSNNVYNINEITVIDDGEYQGTQLYLIHRDTYQPDANDYVFTHNWYGSCSGCDTLQSIHGYYSNKKPDEEQIKDYMLLSLHIVENIRYLIPREEKEN